MKKYIRNCFASLAAVVALLILAQEAKGQILAPPGDHLSDSIKKEYNLGPYFKLYKDNYFTVGTTIGHKPTATNSDVKFQISVQIRLTNAVLPWQTYLYLFYTQKTFWNVFQNSMPMRDMNFNPGLGWAKPFFVKNRFIGQLALIVEHESNGRDGLESRSWNKVSLAGNVMVTDWLRVHAKYWVPIVDGENNRDILSYSGLWQYGFNVLTRDKRWEFGATFIKRAGKFLNYNTILEASWRVSKKANINLFAQYYNGYGENLLDYNVYKSMLRVGIVFKPYFFSEY